MIHAIILAAGESRRMGKQKMLLPYGGKTVIEHIVTRVLQCGVGGITVVLGHDAGEIAAKLTSLPVQQVVNDKYAGGMITSVRHGLETVPPETDATLIVLGDQPDLSPAIVSQLIEGFRRAGKGIAVPLFEGRRGHPILVSTNYRDAVMTRYEDTGLRGLLVDNPEDVAEISVDHPGILQDMDTTKDYARELRKLRESAG
ncbi:MAG: nucleotidyltransferase family protein [Verrucomicrobiota bacterium]|jgi:molybdenum cofactor cytidylyltransferase|nr:nucleotidyltransferase family protein [Verrucomicrobiota bacterium]MDP7177022.1 nucleotidyltransferase family protein [Verrucomicrobiota bacterium]MDP7291102.1 nucleotidyltransferase family protein [Verrucomicrobiota bacterium]MDP7441126.1 nucleotidyltransferase family protein [Verrucomicrobiota bacterium]|tara:strand:+ start:10943 stop:11542 length:600 start_codon:yes stop_codon:yes gene_type:complete